MISNELGLPVPHQWKYFVHQVELCKNSLHLTSAVEWRLKRTRTAKHPYAEKSGHPGYECRRYIALETSLGDARYSLRRGPGADTRVRKFDLVCTCWTQIHSRNVIRYEKLS